MENRSQKEAKTPGKKFIFVDTSAFFSHFHSGDSDHDTAREIYQKLREKRYVLVTINFIIAEAHQLMVRKINHQKAREWLKAAYSDDSELNILTPSKEMEAKAREIIYKYKDKDFSLTDAISFVFMKEFLGTDLSFSFDSHFEQYGLCQVEAESL